MAVIYVDVEQRSKYIMLGEQGEKNAVVVKFDISTWLSAFGSGGSAFVDVMRPGDATAYTKQIELEGSYAVWSVDDIDNAVAGKGKVQLTYLMPGDDGRSKTATFVTMVDKSLDASGDVPDPYESYLEEAREIRAETTQNAQTAQAAAQEASTKADEASTSASEAYTSARSAKRSEENAERSASTASEAAEEILGMTATATTLPEGSDATVDYNGGVMAFGIPRGDTGERGAKGDTGETGATPQMSIGTVETLEPDEDATATITGTAEAPVLNLGLPKGETGDVSKADLASLMPLETASGSVASFSDGSSVFSAEQALVTLEPVQDLHGYDKPWAGGNGKNKCNVTDATVTSFTELQELTLQAGVYTLSADVFNNSSIEGYLQLRTNYIVLLSIPITVGDSDIRKSASYTLSTEATIEIVVAGATSGYEVQVKNVQLEEGSTATAYEPYSNICPISGHDSVSVVVSGINVWDEEWEVGSIGTSDGQNTNSSTLIRSKNYVPVIPNMTYFVKAPVSIGGNLFYYDADKNYLSYVGLAVNTNYTIPSNARYVRFRMGSAYGATYNHDICINYPSTDTEYHPSQGVETYTTTFPETVYGGTVDLASGVLTVDMAMVTFDGTEAWTWEAPYHQAYMSKYDMMRLADYRSSMLCDSLPIMRDGYVTETVIGASGYIQSAQYVGQNWIYIRNHEVNSRAEFLAWISELKPTIVYELATPQTYQLTPQAIVLLTGDNNVWSDSGSIEVKYRANIGLYVDKKISEVNA